MIADLNLQRFVIYDPLEGSEKGNFAKKIEALRVFIADYVDNFPMQKQVEDDSEEDDGNQLLPDCEVNISRSVSHSEHA